LKQLSTATIVAMTQPELLLSNVHKRFGGVVAIKDLSLSIRSGEIHGLIGPNGAGKSTTISLASGFLRPTSGSITWMGRDITRSDPASIATSGLVRTYQHAAPLAGLSVLENILVGFHGTYSASFLAVLLGLPAARRESDLIAREAHALLQDYGLADDAEVDAADLTFGQLRFLEIARAVAMKPKLLLLDEPAAGLNTQETEFLRRILNRLRDKGIGLLVVDHDVQFIFALCQKVTAMNFGSVIASGSPHEIYNNAAVREAYLGNNNLAVEALR
jgi:ABC-type branched-subunit amino acid transport system ATPase component